jgi:D-3-phosphoglycerate dehydrogenase / 2-oxoglutarate reductase
VSDGATIALLEELAAPHAEALRSALPAPHRIVQADAHRDVLAEADYVVVRDGILDGDAIAAAPRLRRVVRIDLAGGQVDESALAARSIPLDLVPSTSLMSVGEHAVMCILALLKRFPEASERLRRGEIVDGVEPSLTTQDHYAFNWVGLEHFEALRGATVGLVGVGRIGLHTAALLRAFGADVVYTKRTRFSPDRERDLGVRFLPFEDLLAASHVVSLHLRFTAETERMMGAREFARMPTGSFFVNTSRGRLVDEDALRSALVSGHLAGAALDVFWLEPLPSQSPLLTTSNLILTPHSAGIPAAESQTIELREAGHLIARDAEQASAGPQ